MVNSFILCNSGKTYTQNSILDYSKKNHGVLNVRWDDCYMFATTICNTSIGHGTLLATAEQMF